MENRSNKRSSRAEPLNQETLASEQSHSRGSLSNDEVMNSRQSKEANKGLQKRFHENRTEIMTDKNETLASEQSHLHSRRSLSNDEVMNCRQSKEASKRLKKRFHEHRTEIMNDKNDIADSTKPAFDYHLDIARKNFDQVESAQHLVEDLKNVIYIGDAAKYQPLNLSGQRRRLNADEFVHKLVQRGTAGGSTYFDWSKLGAAVGACFHGVAPVDFLLGPIAKPVVQKKKVVRRKPIPRPDPSPVEPKVIVKHTEIEEKTTLRIQKLQMSITAKTREAHRSNPEQYNTYSEGQTPSVPLGLVELLVTPKSFTQTVENFFDFSFEVKNGTVGVDVDDELPVTYKVDIEGRLANRQMIVALTMKDYADMVHSFEIKNCALYRPEGDGTDYVVL